MNIMFVINRLLGQLVRVYLLAVITDHPAMCKIGGFADHGHGARPCSKCNISQAESRKNNSLCNGEIFNGIVTQLSKLIFAEFTLQNGKEYRAKCLTWLRP